jgi:glyoxylase-like metal-dependent hydrolase (beta-lactamase superfamily II)/dienelactone hydrolase
MNLRKAKPMPTDMTLPTRALALVLFAYTPLFARQPSTTPVATPEPPATVASVVDKQIGAVEKLVTDAAEAMPEAKWGFSPEGLRIPGSDYAGVRTFAQEVRHVAASNYALWWRLTGETFPDDFKGGNGPEGLKTKAQILTFLRDSFALGHRAAATLTPETLLEKFSNGRTRLHLATFGVAHAYDHYGQMVEYLRMNGIVPPASRADAGGASSPSSPTARAVELKAPDGTRLAASDFAPLSAKPGPGVLLLHQGNRPRTSWDPVAARLAAAGIHTVTVDMRGFGESGGSPHERWTAADRAAARKARPGDVEAAWQFLLAQPGVASGMIGIGGAGADGVWSAVAAARRHPAEVKSLVLLSGQTDREGRRFLAARDAPPTLYGVADDDEYPPTQEVMEWTYSTTSNPGNTFVHYAGTRPPWLGFEDREGIPATGGHGTDMFGPHPELPAAIADWFVKTLIATPGRAAPDPKSAPRLASTAILKDIETPGGADRAAHALADARRANPKSELWPEIAVTIMGYDQLPDAKAAVAILKLNVAAYPDSADAHDSLGDAYLADGQKPLARAEAEKALALLPSDTSDSETRKREIRDSAQGKLDTIAGRTSPAYSIQAIRYATIKDFPVSALAIGAPEDERIDIAMVLWLIRGGGHTILFDSGFHREKWLAEFPGTADFLRPDEAVRLAGIAPDEVTDVVISHAHWDHMGGVDLFPKAAVWIQKQEYAYYTGDAWRPGGQHGGIDPDDVKALERRQADGLVRLVDGDGVEILPGIRAYTGARHTFASQYIRVDGDPPFVLASDNCYLYRNLAERKASATFSDDDRLANVRNQDRMMELAGSPDRVVPGHDPKQFEKFPTQGRVATIR